MVTFGSVVSLGIVVTISLLLVTFIPRRRGWISVGLAVSGLLGLAIAGTVFGRDEYYSSFGADIWPAGPALWAALAVLVILLKLRATGHTVTPQYGRPFSIAFLAWTMVTVASSLMMLFVRHGVTAYYDEVVMFGILTLGLSQLGFAGTLEEGLVGSKVGRIAWRSAIIVGCLAFLFSWVLSIMMFVFAIE